MPSVSGSYRWGAVDSSGGTKAEKEACGGGGGGGGGEAMLVFQDDVGKGDVTIETIDVDRER